MATYELPPLPYDYDALEPHIDSRIMELHHDAHHQGYVDGANAALDSLEEMRESGDFSDAKPVERSLSFNLSGHVNHSVFWGNMSPDGGGEPGGELADKIEEDFSSTRTTKASTSTTGGRSSTGTTSQSSTTALSKATASEPTRYIYAILSSASWVAAAPSLPSSRTVVLSYATTGRITVGG
jgi:hypothetical protein